MKTNKYLLLVAAGALMLNTGCDQDELDIPQKGVTSMENFYQTDKDAESAVTIAYATTQKLFSHEDGLSYNYGPYFGLTNWMGDDIFLTGTGYDDAVEQRQLHQFVHGYDHLDIERSYYVFYSSILKCNYVINNFTEARLGTLSDVQKKCVAEARAMRAFDHMLLGIYWGTPPIVDTVLTPADRPANAESQEAVMNWVVKECDLAAKDLPWRNGQDDYEGAVRITKGFALAVKGKAQLWLKDYAGAKASLKEVIESGNYALVPSDKMTTIGHADGKGSSEVVFEFNYDGTNLTGEYDRQVRGGWNDQNTFTWRGEYLKGKSTKGALADQSVYASGWSWVMPSKDFAESLIANDGMESARRKAWIKTYDEILYDFQWTSDGDNFIPGKTASKASDIDRGISQDLYGCMGYFVYKINAHPCQGDQLDNGQLNRNASIMRYAEVLLMYAEACAQLGETSGDGLAALNEIQNRAQSKTVSSALSLEAVQNEKKFEMWLEGCRFVDLVRWGKTETLEHQDEYVPWFSDAILDGESEHRGYAKDDEAGYWKDLYGSTLGFKKGKHELLPFPKRAMDLNSSLKQNPGW